jgi:hypothetical protein
MKYYILSKVLPAGQKSLNKKLPSALTKTNLFLVETTNNFDQAMIFYYDNNEQFNNYELSIWNDRGEEVFPGSNQHSTSLK